MTFQSEDGKSITVIRIRGFCSLFDVNWVFPLFSLPLGVFDARLFLVSIPWVFHCVPKLSMMGKFVFASSVFNHAAIREIRCPWQRHGKDDGRVMWVTSPADHSALFKAYIDAWIRAPEDLLSCFALQVLSISHHQDRDSVLHSARSPADTAFNL